MKRYLLNKEQKLEKDDLEEVIEILNTGQVVVVPTDTSYGLAARIDNEKALKALFSLKQRKKEKTLSMAVRSRGQAQEYGVISCKPTALWKTFLPGPLTLVVWSKKKKLPFLLRKDGTVAIRQVPTKVVQQVLKCLPVPVTITSANKAGKPDIYSYQQFLKQYQNGKLPAAFIDAGKLAKRNPSTVVSALKGEPVHILRKGPISEKKVREATTS